MKFMKGASLDTIADSSFVLMIMTIGIQLMAIRSVFVTEQNLVIHAFRQKAGQGHNEQELQQVEKVTEQDAEEAPLLVIFVDAREKLVEILDVIPFRVLGRGGVGGLKRDPRRGSAIVMVILIVVKSAEFFVIRLVISSPKHGQLSFSFFLRISIQR